MPTRFRLLYHLHRVNHETFLFYVHHRHLLFHLLFHLFDIVPNVSLIILASLVAIIQNLILILSIHLTITRLNHCSQIFIPKHILTLTGNPTPNFLILGNVTGFETRDGLRVGVRGVRVRVAKLIPSPNPYPQDGSTGYGGFFHGFSHSYFFTKNNVISLYNNFFL